MSSILILTLDSGGGHLAAAQAIAAALERRYGSAVHTRVADLSKEVESGPLRKSHETYQWLAGNHPRLYGWLWHRNWFLTGSEFVAVLCRLLAGRTLTKIYQSEQPDVVVSVHGLLNHFPERLLRTTVSGSVPFVTVITDMLSFHRLWINPAVDYCIVATEQARDLAVRYGLAPERVEVLGQPVHPRFAERRSGKEHARRELGLDLQRPCVLITSGGDGIGRLYETARAVAGCVPALQLIVVAGRNQALQQRLLSTAWEVPARIYGFADNMPDLMGASDLVVTKAGPGTLAEAFAMGLPVIVSSYIPGQESENPQYVVEGGAGIYLEDPVEIAGTIREWIADSGQLRRMAANAGKLARPQASLRIAERLFQLFQPEKAISLPKRE